jgi:O-antigen biosynthesis protein
MPAGSRTRSTTCRRPLDFAVTGAPALSVIMVLHNQFELTMQTLASLRQNYAEPIDLVLVDNASRDGTRSIEDLVKGATLLRQDTNLGFLRACNLALAHAAAPAVLYLNNDLVLHQGAVRAALERLASDPTIGAVGGKVVRTHGLLQEAGCVLWRDGSAEGWMRDAPPDAPEANYVRDVDFCSGCFLLVDGALLRRLGGFDEAFVPAYYEEVDLCLRIAAAGRRVVYDPAVAMTHYEYGSARSARAAVALMAHNRNVLRARHAPALRSRAIDRRQRADAVSIATRGRRVLMIEDTVPLKRLGSGFGRAAEVLRGLDAAGWQATLFPMTPVTTPAYRLTAELPERVEALWDRTVLDLEGFLTERRGYYDLVWVSRAHNLRRLAEIVSRPGSGLGSARLVLDTEAVFSVRDAAKAALDGLPFNMRAALEREFEGAWLCDHVVAVNEAEAELLRGIGLGSVGVVGFDVPACPTPAPYERRAGLLHVGALNGDESPNAEGLRWYLTHVHPIVEAAVGPEQSRVTVIGHSVESVALDWLREHPGVRYLGAVTDVGPFYDSHRAFIAPTRFAAGVATKILDAASHGVPVACTDLLAGQMGWAEGHRVLSAPLRDPDAFAQAVVRLLTDKRSWRDVRASALRAIRSEFEPARFAAQLREAVVASGVQPPG